MKTIEDEFNQLSKKSTKEITKKIIKAFLLQQKCGIISEKVVQLPVC
jgi:hypothetical protein